MDGCKCPFCELGYPTRPFGTGRVSRSKPEMQELRPRKIAFVSGDKTAVTKALLDLDLSQVETVIIDSYFDGNITNVDPYSPSLLEELKMEETRYREAEPAAPSERVPNNRKQRRKEKSKKKGVSQYVGNSKGSNWNRKPFAN